MGRSPCCLKEGLNRGAWTAHEDKILRDFIAVHGEGRWRNLPKRAGLRRCGKSCRLRWLNYLRPDIKRGNITSDEEELIIRLHRLLGNRWSLIAGRLPGRTDNEIKNYWNTNLGKKVKHHHHRPPHQNNVDRFSSGQQRKTDKTSNNNNNPPNLIPKSDNTKLNSNVVRTKATKCSKVVITPRPPPPPPSMTKSEEADHNDTFRLVDAAATAAASAADYHDPTTEIMLNTDHDHQEPSSAADLLVDFKVGEICLSDLLNSDFSDVCDVDGGGLSPSSDQPFVFSDEILNDWTQSSVMETNVGNNLHSFTSFLESTSEEWLAD